MNSQEVGQQAKTGKLERLAHLFYFLSGLTYIVGPTLGIAWFAYFKALPLLIVIVMLLSEGRWEQTGLIVAGLVFGVMGDLVLEHGGDDLFALGAGFFLVNHIFYNVHFLSLWQNRESEILFQRRPLALLAFILIVSANSINLVTSFSDKEKAEKGILVFLLPVYMTLLGLTAINPILLILSERKVCLASIFLVAGGISYLISDNLLGMTMFGGVELFGQRRINSVLIMTTYYLAQYFIPLSLRQNRRVDGHLLEKSLLSE
jgi:uncharacterized membrane protein YhhN